MEPIICAASTWGPTPEGVLDDLAAGGFTHLCSSEVRADEEWAAHVTRCHDRGLRVIARWPDHIGLGLSEDIQFAFRAFDGADNVGRDGLKGPSHWHPQVVPIAEPTARELRQMGVDGLLVTVLWTDRPFPTDWYPIGCAHITSYWSWDSFAHEAWREFSGGQPMPRKAPDIKDISQLSEGDMMFYRWYQDGWFRRLREYADVAIREGFEEAWTWYIALDFWDAENMADGTAGSLDLMTAWLRRLREAGLRSVTVTAGVLGLWPRWSEPGIATMRDATGRLGWESVGSVGLGHCQRDKAMLNIRHNSHRLAEIGFKGLWGSIEHLPDQPELQHAVAEARAAFEKGG